MIENFEQSAIGSMSIMGSKNAMYMSDLALSISDNIVKISKNRYEDIFDTYNLTAYIRQQNLRKLLCN